MSVGNSSEAGLNMNISENLAEAEVRLMKLYEMCQRLSNETCIEILIVTRNIEIVGLIVSMISVTVGLFIYFHYRILRNNRTKIHINLFIATFLQILFRLILYSDQNQMLTGMPVLYVFIITSIELSRTAMVSWMFIEGLYLHNIITVAVFQKHNCMKYYYFFGWTGSAAIALIWLITMLKRKLGILGWMNYYFLDNYWILEGLRCLIFIINILFLINIIRVLVIKLRDNHTSEIEKIRKAVRAAIFLLPLLGIPGLLFQIPYIYEKPWKFALWAYGSYTINSFQGFFVALLYCFLNEEVQTAIKKSLNLFINLKSMNRTFTAIYSDTDVECQGDNFLGLKNQGKTLMQV